MSLYRYKRLKETVISKAFLTRILKKCWMPLVCFIVFLAIFFSLFRALTPWAKQYKGEVEQQLSHILGQPVSIQSMETSWYWFIPVIKLNEVITSGADHRVIKLDKLLIGINLFGSLWNWHLEPGILYLDNLTLHIHQKQTYWQIEGLNQTPISGQVDLNNYIPLIQSFLIQQKIKIKDMSVFVHLKDGSILPFSHINVTAINRSGHYKLKGEAKLAQNISSHFSLLADLYLNPYHIQNLSGNLYISLQRILLNQWQKLLPKGAYQLTEGTGKADIWLEIKKGKISNGQTILGFHNTTLKSGNGKKSQPIQMVQANLAWQPKNEGWQLSGDKIIWCVEGACWPENELLLTYDNQKQSYRLFIKKILLQSFLSLKIDWPQALKEIQNIKPEGYLEQTQFEFQNQSLSYFLTRFKQLSWQPFNNIPKVKNISGVLYWQPKEGKIEIQENNTRIYLPKKPVIQLTEVNGGIEWKSLSHGLRVSIDNFMLRTANDILSLKGVVDEAFSDSMFVNFQTQFSGYHVEEWLPYIPLAEIKPKLDKWLKTNIKQIGKLSAEGVVKGKWSDFPFDNQSGQFSIRAYLENIDLFFNPDWPLTTHINSYLQFNHRSLDFQIYQGFLKKIPIREANVFISDIGLDHETLLAHIIAEVPGPLSQDYIFSSPLKKHLNKLKSLKLNGDLNLNLRLEIPLYKDDPDVLTKGHIDFNNNQLTFYHSLKNLQLTELTGALDFNENGIKDSRFKGNLFDFQSI